MHLSLASEAFSCNPISFPILYQCRPFMAMKMFGKTLSQAHKSQAHRQQCQIIHIWKTSAWKLRHPWQNPQPSWNLQWFSSYSVQGCGFKPDTAMEQAAKFTMDGFQLYDLPIHIIEKHLDLQAQGVWRFLHTSRWSAVCTTIPVPVCLSRVYSIDVPWLSLRYPGTLSSRHKRRNRPILPRSSHQG